MTKTYFQKSLFSIVLCTMIGMSSFVFADTGSTQTEIGIAESNQVHANVGGVNLQFCNKENLYRNKNNLTLDIEPGATQEICMEFSNQFAHEVQLKVNLIDGGMTNDQVNPKRSCQNETSKEFFGKYVKEHEQTITIPAKSSKQLKTTLQLPEDQVGFHYGCVSYSIPKEKKQIDANKSGIGYDVLIRKAGLIDIKVKGELNSILVLPGFETQSISGSSDIIRGPLLIEAYEGHLDLYSSIKNTGTVPQKLKASGILKDILGRTTLLQGGEMILAPNEEKTIHLYAPKEKRWYFNYFGNKKSISRYRGSYKGFVKLDYTPYLPQGTSENTLTGGSYKLGGSIFLMPRWLVILIALITSYCIYRSIKKKKTTKKKEGAKNEQRIIKDEQQANPEIYNNEVGHEEMHKTQEHQEKSE